MPIRIENLDDARHALLSVAEFLASQPNAAAPLADAAEMTRGAALIIEDALSHPDDATSPTPALRKAA